MRIHGVHLWTRSVSGVCHSDASPHKVDWEIDEPCSQELREADKDPALMGLAF